MAIRTFRFPHEMKLSDKQQRFVQMLGQLLQWIYSHEGWGVTLAEAYRPPDVAELYAKQGRGIKNSLHCKRLAIDLMFFIDGEWQQDGEAYRPIGEHWEFLGGAWGGRFNDAVHFSLEHGGIK